MNWMQYYILFAAGVIFIVWIYLFMKFTRDINRFRNDSGINPFSFRGMFTIFNPPKEGPALQAWGKHIKSSFSTIKIWLLTILFLFLLGFFLLLLLGAPGSKPVQKGKPSLKDTVLTKPLP